MRKSSLILIQVSRKNDPLNICACTRKYTLAVLESRLGLVSIFLGLGHGLEDSDLLLMH